MKHGLTELLRDADFSSLIPGLFLSNPKEVLSLIPTAPANRAGEASSLAEYFQEAFHQETWQLRLIDLWGQSFEILVGDPDAGLQIEMVPEWLAEYRARFEELRSDERRFVARKCSLLLFLSSRVSRSMSFFRRPMAIVGSLGTFFAFPLITL